MKLMTRTEVVGEIRKPYEIDCAHTHELPKRNGRHQHLYEQLGYVDILYAAFFS